MDPISYSCALNAITMKKSKPAMKSRPASEPRIHEDRLKGWNEIAGFLGQPVAVAQRWAKSGMPVTREGRYMYGLPEELSRWVGREAGLDVPVHIASGNMDLSADLRRALSYARAGKGKNRDDKA
jgi:hypothetical protein